MPSFHKKFELSPRLKLGVRRGHGQILKYSSAVFLILAAILAFNAFRLILRSRGQEAVTANSATPQVLGVSDVKTSTDSGETQFVEYKVQKGDTLFNISQKFDINWSTLAALNNLKSPFALKPGQTLKVPR